MSCDSYQRPAAHIVFLLLQNQEYIRTNVFGAHIVQSQLNHAGQCGAALKKQWRKIKVLSENDGVILTRPKHDFLIRGVGRAELTAVV